jgi:hypothetical protein
MLATVKKLDPALDLFTADRPEWGDRRRPLPAWLETVVAEPHVDADE